MPNVFGNIPLTQKAIKFRNGRGDVKSELGLHLGSIIYRGPTRTGFNCPLYMSQFQGDGYSQT